MNATESYDAAIAAMGLTMKADFVPFSKSRNAKEKSPSLNWTVTISNGRGQSITVDYTQGIGHAPSYNASVKELGNKNSLMRDQAMRHEAETGQDVGGSVVCTSESCLEIGLKLRAMVGEKGLAELAELLSNY